MIATTDMWLAPKIAAMKEITDFDVRYAQKLYGGVRRRVRRADGGGDGDVSDDEAGDGPDDAPKGAKLDGTAILTTVTMDAVKSGGADGRTGEGRTGTGEAGTRAWRPAWRASPRRLRPKPAADANSARTTFMTSTNEVLKVATDVTAADVAIPAGFKENK